MFRELATQNSGGAPQTTERTADASQLPVNADGEPQPTATNDDMLVSVGGGLSLPMSIVLDDDAFQKACQAWASRRHDEGTRPSLDPDVNAVQHQQNVSDASQLAVNASDEDAIQHEYDMCSNGSASDGQSFFADMDADDDELERWKELITEKESKERHEKKAPRRCVPGCLAMGHRLCAGKAAP